MKVKRKQHKWFANRSLAVKMFLLFSCASLTAMGITFLITYRQLYLSTQRNQKYLARQRFDQTLMVLEENLDRVENITRVAVGNENVNHHLKEMLNSEGFTEQYAQIQAAWEWLDHIYFGTDYDAVLFFLTGKYPLSEGISSFVRELEGEEGQRIRARLQENGYRPYWTTVEKEQNGEKELYLVFVRPVPNLQDFSEYLGSMQVYIRGERLKENFLEKSGNEFFYIEDAEGNLLCASDPEAYEEVLSAPKKISYEESAFFGDGALRLHMVVPREKVGQNLIEYNSWTIPFFAMVCLLLLLVVWRISRSITVRIRTLSETVKQVRSGRLETLDEESGKDEVGQLIEEYNYMICRIRTLLKEQYQLGQEKKEAELMALQSQINPHFLYNTLDMINWMAAKNETDNIRDTVFSLARYYRLILNKGKDIITIGQEIELCESYIAIQQKRYRGKILFEMDVDDNIREYLIPKITLQPLLENAIVHGIMEKESGRGTILISGWEEDDDILLSVTDDGVGMVTEQEIERQHKGSKYGISNIELRLKLFYDRKQCITYESTKGIGTCVSIRIGKKTGEEQG